VADYLKRNGFQDISTKFEASRDLGRPLPKKMSLERLVRLTSSKRSEEKPLDAWTNIQEGFSDLKGHLDPNNSGSEVDKVVNFILSRNIPARFINVMYDNFSCLNIKKNSEVKLSMERECPGIKFGRFSRGLNGEDGKIQENWIKLITEASIENPLKCIEDFARLDIAGYNQNLLRQNVLGIYLSRGLPYVRLGAEVFNRAVALFYLSNDGQYTEEENNIILNTVESFGTGLSTWQKLADLLKRRKPSNISKHYILLTKAKGMNSGKWTESDFKTFFDHVFNTANESKMTGVEYILNLPNSTILEAAKLLRRIDFYVLQQWNVTIRPILLAYHKGTLHTEWRREFLQYLLNRKVISVQDINWDEAKVHFPDHTTPSLERALLSIRRQSTFGSQPLYKSIQDYLPKLKNSAEMKSYKDNKEKIVYLYDQARGIVQ